jgi:hypothetical protein
MKRILLLLCALLLMADLADDGFLGKVPYLLPHCPGNFSLTTLSGTSCKIASQGWLPLGGVRFIFQRWQTQPVLVEVGDTHAKIDCYLHSSSGGLPF